MRAEVLVSLSGGRGPWGSLSLLGESKGGQSKTKSRKQERTLGIWRNQDCKSRLLCARPCSKAITCSKSFLTTTL